MLYGGPDGELAASLRYLSQRYAMPYPELKAVLTDIGREAARLVKNCLNNFSLSAKDFCIPYVRYKL